MGIVRQREFAPREVCASPGFLFLAKTEPQDLLVTDEDFMRQALYLAERARGRTSPNPMVGAVLVRDGQIIGEGFHKAAGQPHAEINAAIIAGDIEGATLYVTLEPCAHEGRTPPCVDFLIEKRIGRVVCATEDPNPRVSGEGIRRLRAAEIPVDVGLMADEARRMNETYNKYVATGMPFVIAKCAMSLDGKIATRTGESKWVTGEAARERVHHLRNEVDAIMVGSRTVMLDDPSLTTRLPTSGTRDPIRIVIDAGEYLDQDRRVFNSDSTAPTWVVVPDERSIEKADEVLHMPSGNGGVDMVALMRELGRREISSVLLEGGGTTHASAFEAGIVDKVLFFVAPKIIGGREAVTPVEGEGPARMADVVQLENMQATPVGEDLLIEAYVKR
jgi:diaminohydroxyphosphoribosylaminopyrimidine deaminase / 5-amino-6-(5-phosphoribosylamino)uracil reductase